MKNKYIKCKFCDYKVLRWRTGKNGKKINGYNALRIHMGKHHPEKWMEVEEYIENQVWGRE